MAFPLISTILASFAPAPTKQRASETEVLDGLDAASECMSGPGASYARAALDNWPNAREAERRLPASF